MTDQRHVGYESGLERDHLAAFGFDASVIAIASQPFWLFRASEHGKSRSHAPDFFLRREDGCGVVVGCRPIERRKPRDAEAFESTRQACELVGWEYRSVGALDPVTAANVQWLATGIRALSVAALMSLPPPRSASEEPPVERLK